VVEATPPEPVVEPAAAAASAGSLGVTDLRRLWPDVVEAVKHRRRMTWILLSQHAQVVDVDDQTLTVGFNNPGAHQSFLSGGNDEILRQVLIDQIGQAWRIDAIVDPSAQPGEPQPKVTKPAVAPVEAAAPPSSEAVQSAREAIQETRLAGVPAKAEPTVSDADADPDDPDADDNALAGAELLQRELGASVIEEISHHD
jgi:DNA polymerase-3 subunit gamma/tau